MKVPGAYPEMRIGPWVAGSDQNKKCVINSLARDSPAESALNTILDLHFYV
jgi:hypothetical protein